VCVLAGHCSQLQSALFHVRSAVHGGFAYDEDTGDSVMDCAIKGGCIKKCKGMPTTGHMYHALQIDRQTVTCPLRLLRHQTSYKVDREGFHQIHNTHLQPTNDDIV